MKPFRSRLLEYGREWGLLTLAYAVIVGLLTYPLIFNLSTHMAGQTNGDALEFVWSMWWWKEALFTLRQNPLHISVVNFPGGLSFPLLPAMSQSFLLGLPLTLTFSPVVAFNVILLLSLILSGVSGYALCRALHVAPPAAFIGGLIWAVFPNKLGHALAGHLFNLNLFSFALMALGWLNLLRAPSARNAVLAALALVLAATVHPIYIAYFIAPTVVMLVGHAIWIEGKAFWTRARIQALALAAALSGAGMALLLGPTLWDAAQGRLAFLAERGATGFAFDALAYFIPAPNNPLVLPSPIAELSSCLILSEFESIAYLGWVPLLLAVIGARSRWNESRGWIGLGLFGAILALGPLLKFGGGLVQAPVEDGAYPIVMPYSLFGSLPFFAWSRTPGRLSVLIMLALAVLAAFGYQALYTRLAHARAGVGLSAGLLLGCTSLIVAEYLVKTPFPLIPATVPVTIQQLSADSATRAVISVPQPNNEANLRALYWQTHHAKPLVGGRVYRDLPNGRALYDFLSGLLLNPTGADIVPAFSEAARWRVFGDLGVNGVIYDRAADTTGESLRQLTNRLGAPTSDDAEAAILRVPEAQSNAVETVWGVGEGWEAAQDWGTFTGRWLKGRGALFIYSPDERSTRLQFTAVPGRGVHSLRVLLNGAQVGQFAIADWAEYLSGSFALPRGFSRIEFVDDDGTELYIGDPRCTGGSPLSGPYPVAVPCDPNDRTARDVSVVIAQINLLPATSTATPVSPIFGDTLALVKFSAPIQAARGEAVTLHLMWQSVRKPVEDYTVFVHLVGPDGTLLAQSDAQPVNGQYPTSIWAEGHIVAYNISLRVPDDAPAGPASFRMGVYRWPSLERLAVSGAEARDDALVLGQITITP